MKQRILYLLLIAILALSVIYSPVQAQDTTPYIIRSTQPISAELKGYLDAYLAVSPPSSARYYIVTHVHPLGADTVVSMAGVDLTSPDAHWNFEDGIAVWLGSVNVASDGNVTPLTPEQVSSIGGGKPYFAPLSFPHVDVDDSYTKALLHFNGSDGSTTFTDESGKTWSVNGDAQIDTAQSEFGGASG